MCAQYYVNRCAYQSSGNEQGTGWTRSKGQHSRRFVLLMLLIPCCTLLAFAIGRNARFLFVIKPEMKRLLLSQDLISSSSKPVADAMNSKWIITQKENAPYGRDLRGREFLTLTVNSNELHTLQEDEEPVDFPQCEHLLMDIAGVDASFLQSEKQLVKAMLDLAYESGLTMLSYNCHDRAPNKGGVHCVGVSLKSHLIVFTWPKEGVIILDLFTCGPKSLLPIVHLAEKLFAIPTTQKTNPSNVFSEPHIIWAHKYRSFISDDEQSYISDALERTDFSWFPLGMMTDYKKEVLSTTTNFQRVDIYDVLRPQVQNIKAYKKSLMTTENTYEAKHPEQFEPDRIVYLDGIMQSRRSGDAAYHEALVHPSMFAHHYPRRVAIIGGGEGATLREVLKHVTVEKVVMIDIDKEFVDLAKKFLPSWNDCSMLVGSTASCFDDPRADLYGQDAIEWFVDRFSGEDDEIIEKPFDVIIMDALDPQVERDFAEGLYFDGNPFLKSLWKALGQEGLLSVQVGQASTIHSPSEQFSVDRNRFRFIQSLVDLGFESILDFDESHTGFDAPWRFVVAFKFFSTRGDWFVPSSLIHWKMRKRLLPTIDGNSSLLYFDDATMLSYMYPSKASEVTFCRKEPKPCTCDMSRQKMDTEKMVQVQPSTLGLNGACGVFAKEHFAENLNLGLADTTSYCATMPTTTMKDHFIFPGANKLAQKSIFQVFANGTNGKCHWFIPFGFTQGAREWSLSSFNTDSYNKSTNIGVAVQQDNVVEIQSVLRDMVPSKEKLMVSCVLAEKRNVYNPFLERHFFLDSLTIFCNT